MKLSQIDDSNLQDSDIERIVYSNIEDNNLNTKYAIVFGNSMLINERVITAVEAYNNHRIEKLIFTGGVNGVSNQDNNELSEAVRMKNLALELGVKEEDIILEDESNNSFENVENAFKLINGEIDNIAIITSEFHLKRCMAIIKNIYQDMNVIMIHSLDGFSDKDNWFLSDSSWNSGRSLATYEAHLLVKYAKEGKIKDLEV